MHTTRRARTALAQWLATTLAGVRVRARAGVGRRELPPLFPRHAATPCARRDGAATLIAMDAPPPQEDCRPFVHVARLLADAGVHAPAVLAQDLDAGLPAADRPRHAHVSRRARRGSARRALPRRDRRAGALAARVARGRAAAATTRRCCARELELFPDWYVARHLRRTLDARRARDARRRVRRASSPTTSRSRACSSIATTIRAT